MQKLIILTSLFFSFYANSSNLSCPQIHYIQMQFLKNHILYDKLTDELKTRAINQFIKNLDREKMYFLSSDIENIKRKNKKLFRDLKNKRCHGLYYIYNVYSKRVRERTDFTKKFLFDKKLTYVAGADLKQHPKDTNEANLRMKSYIQYQVANIFLFEKDLKKSLEQFSYIRNNFNKQVQSWKPQLSWREIRKCKRKSKNSFTVCKPTKWFSNYLSSYSQSLDSHSSYMDDEELEEFNITMNLELDGIGASLSSRFGYTTIEKLIPGGAAASSNKLKAKDKILAVGQSPDKLVEIFGERIEDVVSIIRGPRGTSVYLKISRVEKNGKNKIFVVRLIRDRVELKEEAAGISYHTVKGKKGIKYKLGLIKVPSFYGSGIFSKSVSHDVKKLLLEAKRQKIQALVLDLSNNRGGSLEEAVDLSGLFFSRGNVVKQSERKNKKTYIFRDRDQRVFYSGPLVVLVNRLSASASEIVAGTLQDYQRAVVVGGDHTFGKGSVQSVEVLPGKLGALKTTVGLYFIPSGRSTQKKGIISDIAFPSIFNIDKINEKSLDFVLPSKKIQSFISSPKDIFAKKGKNWKPVNKRIIKHLTQKSKKRIEKNKDFIEIKKDLAEFQKKRKNQKKISIAEVLEGGGAEDEKEPSDELEDKNKYFSRPDIQEALNIAKDLFLAQKSKLSAQDDSFCFFRSIQSIGALFQKNSQAQTLQPLNNSI